MNFLLREFKKKIFYITTIALFIFFSMAFFSLFSSLFTKKSLKIEERPKEKIIKREAKSMPFYVFSTSKIPYPKNFASSGYMGDLHDLKMTGSYDIKLKLKYPSLKFTYRPSGNKGWSGIMWQNPPNNWGEFDGGYDLTRAGKLTFWARGDKGGEIVEFKVGGVASTYLDSLNLTSGDLVLQKEWIKYVFHLEKFSRQYISGGFGFVVTKEENSKGCIFYLDEIKYEN